MACSKISVRWIWKSCLMFSKQCGELNIRPTEISIQKHGRLFIRFDIMLKLWVQAKFLHVKRLPPPLKPKGHSMHNTALLKPAKAVVSQTMNDAQANGNRS